VEGQIVDVQRQGIADAQAQPIPAFTRRDVRLPGITGKAVAVTGMRRTGKTAFLWQVLAERVAAAVCRGRGSCT